MHRANNRKVLQIDQLGKNNHACFLYSNTGIFSRSVSAFFRKGLKGGEKILCVADGHRMEGVITDLNGKGYALPDLLSGGQMEFAQPGTACFTNGIVNPDNIIAYVREKSEESLSCGFTALRVAIEMSTFSSDNNAMKLYMEYEEQLQNLLSHHSCITLEAFQMNECDPLFLMNVLAAHTHTIVDGQVYENLYYIPPSAFTATDGPKRMLRKTIENIIATQKFLDETRTQEERFRDISHGMADWIWELDRHGKYRYCSDAVINLLGYRPDEILGKSPLDFITPDQADILKKSTLDAITKMETIKNLELWFVRKDGEKVCLLSNAIPLVGKDNRFIGLRGVDKDITRQKTAEMALQESERKYRNIFENAVEGIFQSTPGGRIVSANPALARFFDLDSPGVLIDTVSDLGTYYVDPDQRKEFRTIIENQGFVKNFETRLYGKDGAIKWASINAHVVRDNSNGEVIYEGTIEDITERKENEEKLRFHGQIFDQIHDAVISTDTKGAITSWNMGAERLFGYTKQEMLGKKIAILYPDKNHYRSTTAKTARILAHHEYSETTAYMTDKNGRRFYSHISFSLLRDSKGAPKGIIGYHLDIDGQVRAQEELALEKERLEITLRSIGDGVVATDSCGNISLLNNIAETLTGWTADEAIGKPLSEVFHIVNEKTRQLCENPVDKVLKTGTVIGLANHTILVSKDGRERIIADSGAPIKDTRGQIIGVVLVFRDITEKNKIEEELTRSSKLESLGVLAGGIAHDFNNILSAILGNISLARVDSEPDSPVFKRLELAEQATMRARDLTQQLLTFSRGGTPVKKTASVATILTDSCNFALTGSKIKALFHLPADLWNASVDVGQIGQVFQNLVINSKESMPRGGILEISAENVKAETDLIINGLSISKGDYIVIRVRDHGVGIPEENIQRIFDPFFTTKKRGSGLGLATCYSIIKKHDGYITVTSEPGEGTVFHVYIPATKNHVHEQTSVKKNFIRGKGTILVMDDEDMIRDTLGAMLIRLGYDVEYATDGVEATERVKKAREGGHRYSAVILDLTIPGGMGGKEAIAELLMIDPGIKAIVASGYSNDSVMARYARHGFVGAIHKPFKMDELADILSRTVADGT